MSRQITQPINQVRFTNVAIVRMVVHSKRFEIACYRNKITNYRQGVEKDITEVLQTERIFTNVSKGQIAKSSDLKKAFGTTNVDEICHIILIKGDYQVSDLERLQNYENLYKEIATMIQAKCVNKETNRKFTIHVILEAMKKAEFSVNPTKAVKVQFLDAVKMIQKKNVLPSLERAKMLLCITSDEDDLDQVKMLLRSIETVYQIEFPKIDGNQKAQILIHPSLFRQVEQIVKDHSQLHLEIVQQVVNGEDVALETQFDSLNLEEENQHEPQNPLEEEKKEVPIAEETCQQQNYHSIETNNATNSHKEQKKAMKKSKKAKRREKLQDAERAQRIEQEKQRQESRQREKPESSTNYSNEERKKSCNTCGGNFTLVEYRKHFQSDWHRFNLKLKMKGVSVISEEEFLMCDANILFDD